MSHTVVLGAVIAVCLAGGLVGVRLWMEPTSVAFPVPVYEIEARSGSCEASIANLGIGYTGALEAPTPVDVDCDLLPDVLVAVNLVDVEGPVHDPLATDATTYEEFLADRSGRTIAPNVEINRYPLDALSTLLGRLSPPVRINVKLRVTDVEGERPDTFLRFGYDTGTGGSIPTHFKALVRGLDEFFNPLEAVVDTKGDVQGGDTVPAYYEGPLTLVGGLEIPDDDFEAVLDLAYAPYPDVVKVGYASDDAGHHLDYAHGTGEQLLLGYGTALPDGTFEHYVPGEVPEVDLSTILRVDDGGDRLDLVAAVDRLPRSLDLDVDTAEEQGRLDYAAAGDGRLPDARVDLRSVTGGQLTRAEARVEELPPRLHARWRLGADDDISALFTTSDPDAPDFDLEALGDGPGIGALEVLYSNVDAPSSFEPHVATEQQFLNLQAVDGEQLLSGRLERIRGLRFDTRSDGVDVVSRVGDGALPLETNLEVDGLPESGALLDAAATVSPLPADLDMHLFSGDKEDPGNPFRVVYDASATVDVEASAEVREADAATAACGEPGTTCADLRVQHLPAHLEVAVAESGQQGVGSSTDVAIDAVPRPGAPKPDVFVDAVLGKLDSVADPDAVAAAGPVVLEASGELLGIPETVRLRFVEGADETLERFDVSTCELDVGDRCPEGTDAIEQLQVEIRNFLGAQRDDADVPPPSSVAPQFATMTARGIDEPGKTADPTVRFEAAARVRDITEVRYANVNGLFGVRSVVGDDRDLEVLVDIADVVFSGNDPSTGPVDLRGRALVAPLPGEMNLCLRESGFPLSLADSASFTDHCEDADPFGDGSADVSPLTFAYDASGTFDVDASVDFTAHGQSESPADDHDIRGVLAIDNVPRRLTAHVQSPPSRVQDAPPSTVPERLRVRTIAPGATDTDLQLEFEDRRAGATCAEPQPPGDVTCVAATVTRLPHHASLVADSGPGDATSARVFACDLDVAADGCRAGTDGLIEELTARLRMVTGDPVAEGDLVPFVFDEHPYRNGASPDDVYVLALRLDQDDEENKELVAQGRLAEFRSVSFDRTEDGFDLRTDLGDNATPLLGSIALDTRAPATPPEGELLGSGKLVLADTRVDPLPQIITISQHGPGNDQREDPLEFRYESTAPVDVEARAQIFDQVAGALCGDHGTVCASLRLDRLPTEIAARVGTFDEAIDATPDTSDVHRRMFVDLDAIPFEDVADPDLVLNATLGTEPEGAPPFDDTPIVARGELHGFSQKARLRLSQSGKLQADASLAGSTFEEALFVTCELVEGSDPPSCGDNPQFPVREIGIAARNFQVRPTDFPVPRRTDVPARDATDPLASDAMYAEAVARGEDFEAHAGFTSVREFRMVNVDQILGVKVGGGDGQAFDAHGDFAGLSLPDEPVSDDPADGVEERTLSVDAATTLSNVPTEFSFCLRHAGAPIKSPSGDFTEPCEDAHPFSDAFFAAAPPERGHLAMAYRANAPITEIVTTARARVHRAHALPVELFPGVVTTVRVPLPTVNVAGDVTLDHVPEHLTAHIEVPVDKKDDAEPKEDGGPIRALFYYDDAPSVAEGGPPVDISVDAAYTLGDAVCRDLREDQVAVCLSGKLENLPSRVKAFVDPEATLVEAGSTELVQNLRVATDNTDPAEKLHLRDIDISVVKDDDPDKEPLVLIVEGDILGLPAAVDGTIHMPDETEGAFDAPAFDIVANPPLDKIDVEVRNFVAPDVMPPVAAPRGGRTADQSIVFQQRGDLFKAVADIEDVAGGGYRTGRNALGQATETKLIRVDFGIPDSGPAPTIRGYVDLLTENDDGDPTHVFADVLLDDVPHGIDLCFRGELPPPAERDHDLAPAPGTELFCDLVADHLGAFRFQGRVNGDPEPELDVDAVFRMTKDSDTNVLKAIADVRNIPNVIEGTFGDGAVSVQSFRADGGTPAGIDDVALEMADFDFDDDGYGAEPPWGARVPGTVVLPRPQPGPAHEFARVAADGTDFHVKARVGTAHDGSEGARITAFVMDPTPCPQPAGAGSYFPHFPLADGNEYICVRGDLEQHSPHPLLLDADVLLDGTRLKLLDAGLTELPQWFQANIAKTPTLEERDGATDAFRRRCRTAAVESDDTIDCMPPLLHFDSEGDAQLFASLHVGEEADVELLGNTDPARPMVDLDAHPVPPSVRPGPDQWSEFPGGMGVRVKLGELPPDPSSGGAEDRKAVRASLRLDVPRALTVDQIQKWSYEDTSSDENYRSASDLRFHYVLRDAPTSGPTPQIVGVAGELAAMIHNYADNGQTLVSKVDGGLGGIPIPGELGLDLFQRDYKGRGRRLIQADLRSSSDLAARVRLIAGHGAAIGDSDFRLTNLRGVPAGDASYQSDPEKPSFRLRSELKDPPDQVEPPEEGGGDWKDALLCVVWCIAKDIGAPQLTAELDLEPNAGRPVRLVEAVLNTRDDKLGAELRSYGDVEGTIAAEFASDSPDPGSIPLARGGVHVDLNPFNFFLHAGVPVLASFDLLILGEMNVDLNIGSTDRFVLRQNATAIQTASSGADASFPDLGSDTWLQVSEAPGVLAGYFSLFWPFPPVYIFYGMAAGPVVPFYHYACPTPAHVNGLVPWTLPILPDGSTGPGLKSTAYLPFRGAAPDPLWLHTFGGTPPIVKPILDGVFGLAGPPIMCAAFGTDGIDLHSGPSKPPSFNGDRSPGDPMVIAGHPIPGLGISGAPGSASPPTAPPADEQNLTVTSGQTLALCGTHAFRNVSLHSGATVTVATSAGDDPGTSFVDCPADQADDPATPDTDETQVNVGRLDVVASAGLTINGTVNGAAGGGLKLTGDNLTVGSTGRVNGSTGLVELSARNLTVGGLIQGTGVASSVPRRSDTDAAWAAASTGNAGASHGGSGGLGSGVGGSVGPRYGSGVTADVDPGTETGSPGGTTGAMAGGQGGGVVTLRGSSVTVSGTIRMNGQPGQGSTAGQCSVADDPDQEGDQSQPNTGVAGAGGGSGGGVAIHGVTVNVTGLIEARGGNGGGGRGGAGGGGGGGVVRLNAGDVDPDGATLEGRVVVARGLRGTSLCTNDFPHGQHGTDGVREVTETPQSHALPTDQFWFHPDDVAIPYRAAAAVKAGVFGFDSDDFVVHLCGVHRGPEAIEDGAGFGLQVPSGQQPTSANPCGTKHADQPAHATPRLLATVTHEGAEVSPNGAVLDPGVALDTGVWGLWTVAAKPVTFLSTSCRPFYPFFDSCLLETNPPAPEVTIGVDPNPPTLAVAPAGTTANADGDAVTRTPAITLALSSVTDDLPRSDGAGSMALSGVAEVRCYVQHAGSFTQPTCSRSGDDLNLVLPGAPPAEGRYDVYIVAVDQAGNTSAPLAGGVPDVSHFDDGTADHFDDDRVHLVLDDAPPQPGVASITAPAAPTGANGWYTSPPTQYRIDGFDDGPGGSGQHADGGFQYRFDGADWTSCVAPCVIEAPTVLPGGGKHRLTWKAVDGAGLSSAQQSIPILVDGSAPKTAVAEIPVFGDEWITAAHPLVVARGADGFSGSGLEPTSSDPALCDGNSATGAGLSGTCVSVAGPGGPYAPYNGAVELASGEDQVVCAFSVDVAGNVETPASCTGQLDIDNELPTGSIDVDPATPTGNSPWFDGDAPVPTVTLFDYDGTGSPAPAEGGFRYRVDNSDERACANPCVVDPALLNEGSNVLHWTAVDSAGNRRPEEKVDLFVDADDPRSHLLVEPAVPAGSNGWYVTRPWVALVGFDEPVGSAALRPRGSGVDAIRYTLDGDPFTYDGPFDVPPGDHELCVLAGDVAGNEEADGEAHCHRIAFDDRDPSTSVLQNGSLVGVPDGDNGWHRLHPVTITQDATDADPGSGLSPQDESTALCDHTRDADPAPTGVCVSVDGRAPGASIGGPEFGPATEAVLLGEGEHVIRAFSVDNAGRRSTLDREVVLVDRSDPVSVARLRAPHASHVGSLRPWWRHQPTLVLRGLDGDQNAGVRRLEYRIDSGPVRTYEAPVVVPAGIRLVEHRAVDESGRVGPWQRKDVAVDVRPPVVEAGAPKPSIWVFGSSLGIVTVRPDKAELHWSVGDELSGRVAVRVIVYNEAGLAVRHLDGGVHTVTPGRPPPMTSGFTHWDGKDDSLIGFVPAGVYYYRVVAVDDAGNVAMSGESKKLQLKWEL